MSFARGFDSHPATPKAVTRKDPLTGEWYLLRYDTMRTGAQRC